MGFLKKLKDIAEKSVDKRTKYLNGASDAEKKGYGKGKE